MNRRGFLGSILAACAAPAIVRADSLMRIEPRQTDIVLVPWQVHYSAVNLNPDWMARVEEPNPPLFLQYGDVIRYESDAVWQKDPLLPQRAQRDIDQRLDALGAAIGRPITHREYVWFPRGRFDKSDPLGQRALVAGKGFA